MGTKMSVLALAETMVEGSQLVRAKFIFDISRYLCHMREEKKEEEKMGKHIEWYSGFSIRDYLQRASQLESQPKLHAF